MAFPPYTPDHYTPANGPVASTFTSIPEIERLLSFRGKKLHLDDLDDDDPNWDPDTDPNATDANAITEIIQRVTSRIMEYLAPRYKAEAVQPLPAIREIATFWACYELTLRRGNEPLYSDEVIEGQDRLQSYRDGTLFLDAPSSGSRAVLQSYIVDNRYTRNPVRVLKSSSTSVVSGQHLAWEYPFFWL